MAVLQNHVNEDFEGCMTDMYPPLSLVLGE